MRIAHIADNHGYFPDFPGEFDFVVHSGDLYPYSNNGRDINKNRTKKQREIEFQRDWIIKRIDTINDWLRRKPLLYCAGNHDFFNPCELLNKKGIDATDLTNKNIDYAGYKWYGFPYVNYLKGEWNWELDQGELWQQTQWLMDKMGSNTEILVAHNPMYGVLDGVDGIHIGNTFLQNAITYRKTSIRLLLSGHIHESPGFVWLEKMNLAVSNAAGTSRIIKKIRGKWQES